MGHAGPSRAWVPTLSVPGLPLPPMTTTTPLGTRLNQVLAQLLISDAQGATSRYGDGPRRAPGRESAPPPQVSSIALEWAAFAGRMVEMAEHDLAALRGTAPRPGVGERRDGRGGRVSSALAAGRRGRIAGAELYRGRPPEFVAYVEGCSAEHVRRVRGEKGLDPATGLRRADARLTAPAAGAPRAAL
jgi:hypothetical protein